MKKLLKLVIVGLFAASVGVITLHAADWYEIHESTTTDGATTVFQGAGFLHKVIVSSAGVGSFLTISDTDDSLGTPEITGLDTTVTKEFEYNVGISSGLTYQTTANTSPAAIQLLYRRGSFFPENGQVYRSTFTLTADDTATLFDGAGILYKVITSSDVGAGDVIDLFDSSDDDTSESTRILRHNSSAENEDTYNVIVTSGLAYTATGNAGRTVIYKIGTR